MFRNLDTASGTVNQNVKLVASDGATSNGFGSAVSLSGTAGLVGAYGADNAQGAAYMFRNLDTASGTVNQNVKLVASDGSAYFGSAVSLSGTTGLVGADLTTVGSNTYQGAAYVFRNLDTASGTVNQDVKLVASDGAAYDRFGIAVSLSGDQFIIGPSGANNSQGKSYSGSVASVTTLDTGNTTKIISGISFISQDDWVIGNTTSGNQVTLSKGDSANVTASGKAVYIGQTTGAANNKLLVQGTVTANAVTIGNGMGTGNTLEIDSDGGITSAGMVSASSNVTVGSGGAVNLIGGMLIVGNIGAATPAANSLTIGSGGTVVNASVTSVGGNETIGTTSGGAASFTQSGGTDTSGGVIYIGSEKGSFGTFTLSSNGYVNCSQNIVAGYYGNGTLSVSGAGTINDAYGATALYSGSTGTTTISGAGSAWNNSAENYTGYQGNGTLNITSGGAVTNTNGMIGYYAGSNGTVTIAGTGSTFKNSLSLYVGGNASAQGGNGTLNVNGGVVSVANTLKVYSTGTVSLAGGEIDAGSVDLSSLTSAAAFNFSSGTISVTSGQFQAPTAGTTIGNGTAAALLQLHNASVTNGGLTIANAATFAGSGTVTTPVTVSPGGTLAPSKLSGQMKYSANLTLQTSGSTHAIAQFELGATTTPGTTYDQVVMNSGVFTTGGATLQLVPVTGAMTGQTYVIVSATGGSITYGTPFSNLTAVPLTSYYLYSSGLVTADVTYSSTAIDVTLLTTPEPGSLSLLALGTLTLLRRRRAHLPANN